MKVGKTLQKACRVLKAKIRFKRAHFRLSDDMNGGGKDTELIKAATKQYVETWVIPIIDAIEKGDMKTLKYLMQHEED